MKRIPLFALGLLLSWASSASAADPAITGKTVTNIQNTKNPTILNDGSMGYDKPQIASSGAYPVQLKVDLGKVYNVSAINLFHGTGSGHIEVAYQPSGSTTYTVIENHLASIFNGYEKVKQTAVITTRYLRLSIASAADFYNISEIQVLGLVGVQPVPSPTPSPSPKPSPTPSPSPVPVGCTMSIGSGSGSITLNSSNAKSGSIVCLKAGTYTGATLQGLSNVKIQPTGPVTFNGSIDIFDNNGLTIDGTVLSGITYGITFTGFTGYAFTPGTHNNQNLKFSGMLFQGIGGVVDGTAKSIVYTGSPSTMLFYKLTFDKVKLTGSTYFIRGAYDGPTTYKNIFQYVTLTNVVLVGDGVTGSQKVSGVIYNLIADHWTVTGPNKSDNETDHGIFNYWGNGEFSNIYRNGGFGYIARIIGVSLGAKKDTYFYNIVDVNTIEYGTMDIRIQPGDLNVNGAIPLVGTNFYVWNITSGNKNTRVNVGGGYRSPLMVMGEMTDGLGKNYIVELKNCFAFHNAQLQDGKGSLYRDNSGGNAAFTMSNNIAIEGGIDTPLPAGYLADLTQFYPASGGFLVGKGLNLGSTKTATDIYGVSRGTAYDIGAVQHK